MNKDWCASGREIVYKHIADVPKRMPGNGHGYYGYKRRNWLPTSLAVRFSTRARSRPPWRRVALAAVPAAAVRCGTATWPEESLRVWAAVESPFRGELAHPAADGHIGTSIEWEHSTGPRQQSTTLSTTLLEWMMWIDTLENGKRKKTKQENNIKTLIKF